MQERIEGDIGVPRRQFRRHFLCELFRRHAARPLWPNKSLTGRGVSTGELDCGV